MIKLYEKKIDPEKGGSETYIHTKIQKVQKHRVARVESRKDRKIKRKEVVSDDYHHGHKKNQQQTNLISVPETDD